MMILQLFRRILSNNKVVSLCDFLDMQTYILPDLRGWMENSFYKQNHAKGR